jgi:NDP-sugar pyrophosphorylase family protein
MLRPEDFFDLSKCKYSDIFDGIELVWDALKRIPGYVRANLKPGIYGTVSPLAYVDQNVYIGPGTVVEPGAMVKGPSIIGANCEVRSGAYVRGDVLVGDRAVVGHTTELKNCLLFDQANVPHFAYVGDSILGWKAHLGAGVKISNLKVTRTPVVVTIDGQRYETGLLKFGAILGDEAEIGCNSVLNPGTLVGKRTLAYTNLSMFGYYPPDSMVKLRQTREVVGRRNEK